jgi:pSer/pThr/pTyr-binding forkhead associated (FHA) protein
MPLHLVALRGGPDIPLNKPLLLLGRQADCDVQLRSRKVSRRHCCIARVNNQVFIRDLGSTNGIRINGIKVTAGQLTASDELSIAKYRYRLRRLSQAGAGKRQRRASKPIELPGEGALSSDLPVALAEPEAPPRVSPTRLPATRLLADEPGPAPGEGPTEPDKPPALPRARWSKPSTLEPARPASPEAPQEASEVPPAPPALKPALVPEPAAEKPTPAPVKALSTAADEEDEDAATPRWLLGAGVLALFLGPAALVCASVLALCDLVLPLSLAGLLTGSAAVALSLRRGVGIRVPAIGTVLSGAVLWAALAIPSLLGPTYSLWGQEETPAGSAVSATPLPGRARTSAAQDPEWADASQAILEQAGLRAQVLKVSIGPVTLPGARKDDGGQSYLLIRVRFQQVQGGGGLAGRDGKPPDPHQATLTDSAGKVYAAREVLDVGGVQDVRRSSLFPVALVEEVFVFEPPPAAAAPLRLEIPAGSSGGTFRFSIPRSMVRGRPRS